MLGRIARFIVNKRYLILALMLVFACISVFMMQKVEVNYDMTKYLPDSSSMKAGMDIMNAEFPESDTESTIRVMFDDLTDGQKTEVLNELSRIEYVDSVEYEAGSDDYNRDNHTLFVINTEYDYNTPEEESIEAALDDSFASYTMVWHDDNTGATQIPPIAVAMALLVLLIVLFAMCGSWIEPLLFLFVIGVAIVINMGTNLILGEVSNVTHSIGAILQLVLSMDYSIILMNRYRQERVLYPDKRTAMSNALEHAFSSIASSSLTTVVGLLMLVFMSFKIGKDLGVVLAKGVFTSMVCVLTMLPGMILAFDNIIQKTEKKTLHVPMEWAAAFSYRYRHILSGLFLLLFAAVCVLQQQTGIAYTLVKNDAVAEVFPAANTLVLVYENEDQDQASKLVSQLEGDEKVSSVTGYVNSIASPYTAEELAVKTADVSDDLSMSADIIRMLYYNYYSGGSTGSMTAGEFLSFVADMISGDSAFSDYMDSDMTDKADMLSRFADAGNLTSPKTASQLAAFFSSDTDGSGLSADSIKDLMLYYYIKKGGGTTAKMTLPRFASFVINEVASDPDYKSMFDSSTMSQLSRLADLTNVKKMTTPYTYSQVASALSIDEEMAKLLFVYYYASSADYEPAAMTLSEFTGFITNDVAGNSAFASYLDSGMMEQLGSMAQIVQLASSGQGLLPSAMAQVLGMDESMVTGIYTMYYGGDIEGKTMTLAQMMDLILNNDTIMAGLDEETAAGLRVMQQIVNAAASGAEFTSSQMADMLGMDATQARMLYALHDSVGKADSWKLSVQTVVNFIVDNKGSFSSMLSSDSLSSLETAQAIINGSVKGTSYTYKQMASLTGMSRSQARQLYLLYTRNHGNTSSWKLSVKQLIDFLCGTVLKDSSYSSQIDSDTAKMLKAARTLINAVVSGRSYDSGAMTDLLSGLSDGFDSSAIDLLYLYKASQEGSDPSWTMSMEQLFDYLTGDVLNDSRFAGLIDDDMKEEILDAGKALEDGKAQLISDRYSRLIITSTYPDESEETTDFLAGIDAFCADNFSGEHHMIGSSAMTYEMKKTFNGELLFITLLTALAIFTIVALTFRSLIIPLILVLIVQCGVYITVTVMGLMGGSIYYLALLIVECILMGATIDYGILLTNYYRESRGSMGVREGLSAAYAGSTHTILTSGLILILVTAIVGNFFEEATVQAIVKTISVGALCATLLILLVLPGILAACDRFINHRHKGGEHGN